MHEQQHNPIEAVRARLDGGRQWHKGNLRDYSDRVCILGAIRDELPGEQQEAAEAAVEAVAREQFPERIAERGPLKPIPGFNDHQLTTFADVEVVLDKASVAWDEAHQ
jgi:hypothetical protein